jgi:GDPmannose 4,6-dehydratase
MKIAFITGVNGQDGSYLSEYLLGLNYVVYGLKRRSSHEQGVDRIKHLFANTNFHIIDGDVTDGHFITDIIESAKPDECYHLAGISFVPASWKETVHTLEVNTISTVHILNAIHKYSPTTRMYFAGSSEQFGLVQDVPQTEHTRFYPRSPYAVSKVASFEMVRNFRESYGLYCCSGLTYNHESPRRSINFVTQKIVTAASLIKKKGSGTLILGDVNAKRDWTFAGDVIKAFHLMLQGTAPKDYVIASGVNYAVHEFLKKSFDWFGLDYNPYLKIDQKLFRPAEVPDLLGDPSLIKQDLGWKAETGIDELVDMMAKAAQDAAKSL